MHDKRTQYNIGEGDLCSNSQPLKTVNYRFKVLHPRCLPRSLLLLYKNREKVIKNDIYKW